MYLKSIERGVSVVGDTACMFIVDIGVGDTIIVIVEMGIAVIVVGDTTIVNFGVGVGVAVIVVGDTTIVNFEMGVAVIVVGDTTIVNFELGDSIRVVVMISGRKGCYTFFF